jgi:hypothetical protein
MSICIARWRRREPSAFGFRRRHCLFGDTEVGQSCPASRVKQHVARLQITVHDTALVRVLQGLCYFQKYRDDFQEASAAQPPEVTSGSQLHRQDHAVAGALWRKHFENAGVIELAGDSVLVLESAPGVFLAPRRRIHHLYRNIHPARTVMRAPNLALSAGSQLIQERIA